MKTIRLLYEMVAGKSRVGNKRKGERDREEQIEGVRDGAWERTKKWCRL
jgi:hypothetical protein